MKQTVCFFSALLLTSVSIAANPQGIRPKGEVDRYTASGEENGREKADRTKVVLVFMSASFRLGGRCCFRLPHSSSLA